MQSRPPLKSMPTRAAGNAGLSCQFSVCSRQTVLAATHPLSLGTSATRFLTAFSSCSWKSCRAVSKADVLRTEPLSSYCSRSSAFGNLVLRRSKGNTCKRGFSAPPAGPCAANLLELLAVQPLLADVIGDVASPASYRAPERRHTTSLPLPSSLDLEAPRM